MFTLGRFIDSLVILGVLASLTFSILRFFEKKEVKSKKYSNNYKLNITTFADPNGDSNEDPNFVKSSNEGLCPVKSEVNAAGYDLKTPTKFTILAGKRVNVLLNIKIDYPEGMYGRIASRSGLATKYGIITSGGVCDPYYTGNIGVILFNLGDKDYTFEEGDRIAQLVLENYSSPEINIVDEEEYNEIRLNKKSKESGFGSSGN